MRRSDESLFGEALEFDSTNPDALLGMARVASESFSGKAADYAAKALAADPKMAAAYALTARIALEDNNPEKARTEAKKAIEIDKESLEALSDTTSSGKIVLGAKWRLSLS